MKILNSLILGGCLLTGSVSAINFGGSVGPVSVDINAGDDDGYDDGYQNQNQGRWGGRGGWRNRGMSLGDINNQVCLAIQDQSRIQVVLKTKDVVSPKELKITTKLVTVEPYALGMTRDGLAILKGNVVEQKNLTVVTVESSEDRFDNKKEPNSGEQNKKGWFNSDTGVRLIDLRFAKHIQADPNSRFDIPKDFKGFQDDKDLQVQVICAVPTNAPQSSGNDQSYRSNTAASKQQGGFNQYNR